MSNIRTERWFYHQLYMNFKSVTTVIKLNAAVIFFLLLALTAFSQRPASDTKAAQIGLFPMPGFEPLPPHKSHIPDTANFKPQNFRFKEIDRQSLTDQLAKGIRLPAVDCKTAWGLFTFRVNASGKVDSTWYRGNLSDKVSDQILKNIRETGGHWIVKPETKSTHVAWFSYTFFDIRSRFIKESKCSEADKELQMVVSSLSNLISNLYYQLDQNHDRATMIMPKVVDGIPRL